MGQKITLNINNKRNIDLNVHQNNNLGLQIKSSRGAGATNYNALTNKPSINGVVLEGDKLDYELYLQHIMDEITEQDIDNIIFGGSL